MRRRVWRSRRLPPEPGTESLPRPRPTIRFLCRAGPASPKAATTDLPATLAPTPAYEVPEPRLCESRRRKRRPSARRATAARRLSEGLDPRSRQIARETALRRPSTTVRARAGTSVRASRQENGGAPRGPYRRLSLRPPADLLEASGYELPDQRFRKRLVDREVQRPGRALIAGQIIGERRKGRSTVR